MNNDFIDEMVNNFLRWELPKDFNPDCFISFDSEQADKYGRPIGTNLFTADQAREMIEHIITGNNRFTENRKSIEFVNALKKNAAGRL